MNIAIIACHVLNRDLSILSAQSDHVCRIFWLEQGLHDTPEILRQRIDTTLDQIEEFQKYTAQHKGKHRLFDAVVLGYGLCSNGVVGLKARSIPIIVPRCDDCIALFLGSQQRYLQEFAAHSGIYWYNPGWIETGSTPSTEYYREKLERYTEQYGEDNAQYLMEAENGWITEYKNCIYIRSPQFPNERYEAYTRHSAEQFGWQYHALEGDDGLLSRLVGGMWDDAEFLTCPPGYMVAASHDEKKVMAQPAP